MPIRVLTVFGTRPEAIKMAPVVKALESNPEIESLVAVTAQHRQMLDQVLELFELTTDFDLDLMQPNQDLYDITSRALVGMREVLKQCNPDLVLVHGDTTTCFTACLAAFYSMIPVGHVEAGLRTGNIYAPFPEEANRSLVGKIASLHFAPTPTSKNNLLSENISDFSIFVTGNTVIDALLMTRKKIESFDNQYWSKFFNDSTINSIRNRSGRFILITGHRRENFGQGFIDFCNALKNIALDNPSWLLVYPVHLNPNVQKPVNAILNETKNILLINPIDYLPFVWLLNQCDLVITDSGGIQEEAPSLGKPVLVTREVTERPEAVDAGTVKLVGTDKDKIVNSTYEILNNPDVYESMSKAHNPYGDGNASQRIVDAILKKFIGK